MAHFRNKLLAALPADVLDALQPHLKTVTLPIGEVLSEHGQVVRQVYFPQSGIVSLIVELSPGDIIETAMIGRDGVVNTSASLDGKVSINKSIVQRTCVASAIGVGPFREIALQSERLRSLLLRYEQFQFADVQQSVACNARHSIEARACRWLLRMHDLAGGEDLILTHEEFAQMLGVRRSGVSTAAERLQRVDLISYHRGAIHLIDVGGLQRVSCECYGVVKTLYKEFLKTTSPD